jgi:hypothetical protein
LLSYGDTFLIPTAIDAKEHLWVVVTQPALGESLAVCVSITKRRANSETTTILSPGDHPFITHESIVHYVGAKILDLYLVQQALDSQTTSFVCRQHQRCNDVILRRIQEGLLISKLVENDVKAFCQRVWDT